MGVACEYDGMNFYLKRPPFAPDFGPFAAKCTAFWCKIHCVLVLNALRFGAKRKVKWCKMQCVLVQNTRQNGAKRNAKSINIHGNGINKTFKSR